MTEQVLPVCAEAGQDTAVVLDGATDRDVAELLVESVTGLDGGTRSVEMIPEISAAVVTFSNAAGGWSPAGERRLAGADAGGLVGVFTEKDRFLAAGRCSQSLQRFGVAARPLEPALSVWVENLSPAVDEGATAGKHERRSVPLMLVVCVLSSSISTVQSSWSCISISGLRGRSGRPARSSSGLMEWPSSLSVTPKVVARSATVTTSANHAS